MSNHPNRSKTTAGTGRNPTPAEISALRASAGVTQQEAAVMLHTSLRSYQQWEAPEGDPGHRRMHRAFFDLFEIRVAERIRSDAAKERRRAAREAATS